MKYQLFFTKEAEETFEAISNQILERWGEKQLNIFKSKVSQTLDTLQDSPQIYPLISTNHPHLRKCILHKNCSVFYKILNRKIVHIICFWDNRQEPIF